MAGVHEPVLLKEVIDFLKVSEGWYVDATLGDGGHSLEILRRGGKVIGLDVDPQALLRARENFINEGIDESRFKLIQGNFRELQTEILQTDKNKFKAVLLDLGVSSDELEDSTRGFSFLKEGPLDMRMDPNLGVSAADLINVLTKGELYELFTKFGEEKLAWRFAEALERARKVAPIKTTSELAGILEKTAGGRQNLPAGRQVHPATRVFQALRIAVNGELEALQEGLPQSLEVIEDGGRVLVISFHSLEDRIVKNQFREWEKDGKGRILTKKPVVPTEGEVEQNPRARSAKLRVFEKYDNYT